MMTRNDTRIRPTPAGALALAIPVALALVLTACPSPDQDPRAGPQPDRAPAEPAPDPDRPPPDGIALEESCANAEYGFRVEYPAGWVVNQANGLPPCSAFDPEDVSMPAAGEIPASIAVVIRRDQVSFDRATDFDQDFTFEAVSREEATVDGRRAVVAELEHTGAGMYPEGQRQYAYYVDVDPNTLMAITHDLAAAGPPPYDQRRRILDAMMASLRIQE